MKGFRLGVSQDILPYTRQEVLDADYRFNKFLLGTFELAVKGLAVGAVASLFFLNRKRIIFYGGGFGGGLSFFHEFNPR